MMKLYEIAVPVLAMALLALVVMTQYQRAMDGVTHPSTKSVIPVSTPVYGSICSPANDNCKNLTFDTGFNASDFTDH